MKDVYESRRRPKHQMDGRRFGRLTVVALIPSKKSPYSYLCKCDCGEPSAVLGTLLRDGKTKSCGCLNAELIRARARTHGLSKTAAYAIWSGMISRCTNQNLKKYDRYGGRGIKLCKRWEKFENFFADMGDRPAGMWLDRINNDGDYEPGNCRWATRKQQARNKSTTRYLTAKGETKSLSTWAEEMKLKPSTIARRIQLGWPVERAIFATIGGK